MEQNTRVARVLGLPTGPFYRIFHNGDSFDLSPEAMQVVCEWYKKNAKDIKNDSLGIGFFCSKDNSREEQKGGTE